MKAYWGSRGIAPRILDLGTRWRWVVSFTPLPLYPKERTPGNHWIGVWVGPRSILDTVVKRKIPSLLSGFEPSIIQPVLRPCTTELSRLLLTLCYPWLIMKIWSKLNEGTRSMLLLCLVDAGSKLSQVNKSISPACPMLRWKYTANWKQPPPP
jgi:hypothetical protein